MTTEPLTSQLFVETERPERFLKQLRNHLTRPREPGAERRGMVAEELSGTDGERIRLSFLTPEGTADPDVYTDLTISTGQGLQLQNSAADEEALERLERVVGGHLWRFVHGREAQTPAFRRP